MDIGIRSQFRHKIGLIPRKCHDLFFNARCGYQLQQIKSMIKTCITGTAVTNKTTRHQSIIIIISWSNISLQSPFVEVTVFLSQQRRFKKHKSVCSMSSTMKLSKWICGDALTDSNITHVYLAVHSVQRLFKSYNGFFHCPIPICQIKDDDEFKKWTCSLCAFTLCGMFCSQMTQSCLYNAQNPENSFRTASTVSELPSRPMRWRRSHSKRDLFKRMNEIKVGNFCRNIG